MPDVRRQKGSWLLLTLDKIGTITVLFLSLSPCGQIEVPSGIVAAQQNDRASKRLTPDQAHGLPVLRIQIVGNEEVKDREIRKRIDLSEGKRFRKERLENTIRRLNKWGKLEEIDNEDVVLEVEEQERSITVTIKVKDKKK
jgi:outer membrane protein assembly factor BamA